MDHPDFQADDIENPFAGLRPSAPRLNRDRVLFEAGRASRPSSRGRFLWPIVTLGLAMAVAERESRVVEERGRRQLLEARIEALETDRERRPVPIPLQEPAAIANRTMPPDSYAALSLRIRSGDWDESSLDRGSISANDLPDLNHDSKHQTLRVIDSRGAITF